jgi:hypothetical protein
MEFLLSVAVVSGDRTMQLAFLHDSMSRFDCKMGISTCHAKDTANRRVVVANR